MLHEKFRKSITDLMLCRRSNKVRPGANGGGASGIGTGTRSTYREGCPDGKSTSSFPHFSRNNKEKYSASPSTSSATTRINRGCSKQDNVNVSPNSSPGRGSMTDNKPIPDVINATFALTQPTNKQN